MEHKAAHFDRTLTLSLLFAVIIQAASALVWAGAAGERLDTLEASISGYDTVNGRLIRVEQQIVGIDETLHRIEHRLDRVQTRQVDNLAAEPKP